MEHIADGAQAPASQERSTGELVKLLSEQVSVLDSNELKLAQLEMTRKGKQAGMGLGLLGGRGSWPGGEGPPAEGHPSGTRGDRGAAEGTRKVTGVWPGHEDEKSDQAA